MLFAPSYWNYFKFELEPISTSIYSALHRVLWTPGFLASIMFSKDIYDRLFKSKENGQRSERSNNNQADNQIVQSPVYISPQFHQLLNIVFKSVGKLYFSLYLVHSALIRYDWFNSRELRSFTVFSAVSINVTLCKSSINSYSNLTLYRAAVAFTL